jgi:hypothetical protein
MRILVACERSGVVREAFRKRGHDAWSCDIEPARDGSEHHIENDVRNILAWGSQWDLLIAHPPCTYLARSGLHWNRKDPAREEKTQDALGLVELLMYADIPRICIENPPGRIGTAIDAREYGFRTRRATQYVQPHNFGHDARKMTGLWLKNLPDLQPTRHVPGRCIGRFKDGSPMLRWSNQTDSGQDRIGPSERRVELRSNTYQGIADAMAEQWGSL